MKNYVFFIGGSGARVYKSLIHSAAAGILKSEEISVLLIDADENNSANTSGIKLYREYKKVYDDFSKSEERTIFTCDIKMESEKVLSPIDSDAYNLSLAIGSASEDRRRILHCLYTREEIGQDLRGGFYAHPNIGCVFFSDFRNDQFNQCLNKIEKQLDNGDNVRIALVGSIFGGTGAAGIPTIYRFINNSLKEKLHYDKLKIGGIFLEPYFKVNGKKKADNKNISIIMDEFYFNTYEALSYYKTNENMNFESIYLLGQQTMDIVSNEYADSGDGQNNKAHIVELYASLAIDRFFCCDDKGVFGCVCKEKIDWNSFPMAGSDNMGKNSVSTLGLADFARAQAIYLAKIYHYVSSVQGSYRERLGIMVPQWYFAYNMNDSDEKNKLEILKEYSISFMEWLYMINSTYDVEGNLKLDDRIKLFGSVLEDVYQMSLDMKTNTEGNIKKYLSNFCNCFNTFVDTTSNIEYVLDKVLMIMSMAGIISGHAIGVSAGVGAVELFFKIFSLASRQKRKQ